MRLRTAIAFGLAVVALIAGATPATGQDRSERRQALEVPYLTQTPLLCGGAAAAMVMRFWGDRHADVQQFAALVDTRAGGIADIALESALAANGWRTGRFSGSIDRLATELAAGHPLILILAERGGTNHYVVAIGVDGDRVLIHDPTWGPMRAVPRADLDRQWRATGYRSLLVLPGDDPAKTGSRRHEASPAKAGHYRDSRDEAPAACERDVDEAIDQIIDRGDFDQADEILRAASRRCPGSSRPWSELAGVRFAQSRPREAAQLAEQALELDAGDAYAWEVLGSSRFVLNDTASGLAALNQLGRPLIDSVQISGATRTRQAVIAQTLDLAPNALLSARDYRLAERRLHDWPDQIAVRLGARPDTDGFAVVDVAVQERPRHPAGLIQWSSAIGQGLVNREARLTVPGWTGQGETWTTRIRWWVNRPQVGVSFSAPRTGPWPGVWTVAGTWDRQSYAPTGAATDGAIVREDRTTARIAVSNWLTPSVRYRVAFGADRWQTVGGFVSTAAGVDWRWFADRLSASVDAAHWAPVNKGSRPFSTLDLHASVRSSTRTEGFVGTASASMTRATQSAPLALWPGAGEGVARPDFLRAHPLLDDGVVTGATFGRELRAMTGEVQRWMHPTPLTPLAIAGFVDVARANNLGPAEAGHDRSHIDVGGGIRLRAPGREGLLRVDYAYGLRDGAHAVTVGWTP